MPTKNNRVLLTALGSFTAILLIVVVVLGVLLGSKNDPVEQTKICETKSCINSANLILNNINEEVDPCKQRNHSNFDYFNVFFYWIFLKGVDFNQFACGSFIKYRRIPSDEFSTGIFTDLGNSLSATVSGYLTL